MRSRISALLLAVVLLGVTATSALALGGGLPTEPGFRRADANGDCRMDDLSDPITVINESPLVAVSCGDCTDANDDNGPVDLTDSIHLLNFIFQGGPPSGMAPHDPILERSCGDP